MAKFKINRKFSLAFLGEGWEDSYIVFNSLTVKDIRKDFPELAKLDEGDNAQVISGMDVILNLLQSKFVEGKGINADGNVIELKDADLEDLPVEVLSKALAFLSQGTEGSLPTPSETSSPPKDQ